MRGAQPRTASFRSGRPTERIDEEAAVVQLRNAREQMIRDQPDIASRPVHRRQQRESIERAMRVIRDDDERACSRQVVETARFDADAKNLQRTIFEPGAWQPIRRFVVAGQPCEAGQLEKDS